MLTQTGVVNEALRLSHGLVIRSPRVSPTEALIYKDYSIPAGVRYLFYDPSQDVLSLIEVLDTRGHVQLLRPHGPDALP